MTPDPEPASRARRTRAVRVVWAAVGCIVTGVLWSLSTTLGVGLAVFLVIVAITPEPRPRTRRRPR